MKISAQFATSSEDVGPANVAPALPTIALLLPALVTGIWLLIG